MAYHVARKCMYFKLFYNHGTDDPFQVLSSQLSIVINTSFHKIAEWLRLEGTWRSSGSSLLLKQSHLFDRVQMAFDYV